MDLTTNYLGFPLPHPIVAGASPLVDDLDSVHRLVEAGVAAIVMHSLFEEQILRHMRGVEEYIFSHEGNFPEALTYFPRSENFVLGPEQYLAQIAKVKAISGDIPVIGSLNGFHEGAWIDYARQIEQAGADALELNLYFLPTEVHQDSTFLEKQAVEVVSQVRESVRIPLSIKISPYYTSMPHFAAQLEQAGAQGLVLFNRFYQPDIDIENLEARPRLKLSTSGEIQPRLRWIAMLAGRTTMSLALTGGAHTVEDVIKAIMAGADAVQMVSALLKNGPEHIATLVTQLTHWLEEHEYESVTQMKASMSLQHVPDPQALERANYARLLQSWNS